MANRVLFGQRGSEMGLWISKPGFNVLTASEADMLFLSTPTKQIKAFQIIQSGRITFGGATYVDVYYPNPGFRPVAGGYFYGSFLGEVEAVHPGNGHVRYTRTATQSNSNSFVYWILNLRLN